MPRFILLLLSVLLALFTAPSLTAAAPAPPVYEHNGYLVYGPFYAYFNAHGGPATFGPPLSDAHHDPVSGLKVQLFRYARMELHGELILLSRLGNMYSAEHRDHPAFQWRTPDTSAPDDRFFADSGHSLGGAFGWYHQQHGDVALLGYPISDEFVADQPDGSAALVQYFERAVLRYEPPAEPDGVGSVHRLPLGEWAALDLPANLRTPQSPLRPLASATIAYPVGTSDGANIELAAQRLNGTLVEPGAQLSFLTAVGEISTATGYQRGTAIVNGAIVANAVGGGICTVATLLYRAAWAGGLPIVERRAHRYALRAYADAPGLDAAVYAPGLDLRVANHTGEAIFVVAHATGGSAMLTLWGRGDGRAVKLAAPVINDNGLTIHRSRTIQLADGRQWREQITTRYEPLPPPASPAPVADADQEEEQSEGQAPF